MEQCVLDSRVSPGNAAEEQTFVQEREHALGFHAGFMDAAKCATASAA